jgi:hypothetical protein
VHSEPIRDFLEGKSVTSIDDILSELGIATESRNQIHQNEAARTLQHLGWERRKVSEETVIKGKKETKRVWRYVDPQNYPVQHLNADDFKD